jgi:hypothetical protein
MVCDALMYKQHVINESIEKMTTAQNAVTEADKLERIADQIEEVADEREKHSVKMPAQTKRPPKTEQELWAAAALLKLNADDADRAGHQNGVGFSSKDTDFGNSLAEQYVENKELSPKQWEFAIKICKKYHRQVGHCPEPVVD